MVRSGDQACKWPQLLSWTPHGPQLSTNQELRTYRDVIDVAELAASVYRPEEAVAAFRALRDVIHSTCMLHHVNSPEPEEPHELEYEEWIWELPDFVMVDPPFKLQLDRKDESSEHDLFSADDMKVMGPLCKAFFEIQRNAHLFCTVLQFGKWYWAL